ncbi:MAG: glycosyltransferase family 4 protein [Myxococcota bacterium]|nr:glycosyltransferase family 4 protein [Myxococcota bacterium]
MSLPKTLVVGPFSATAGGVVTFQRNLIFHSDLKERWQLEPFNISRPPKKEKNISHNYKAFLQSSKRRMIQASAITGWNVIRYPNALRGCDVVQIQSSDFYSFWEAGVYTLIAKALGKPVVVRFGGAFDKFYEQSSTQEKDLIRWLLKQPDQIVVQSDNWKEFFSSLTDAERLNIVPNAVPTPPPIPIRNNPVPVALFICTAEAKRKGIDTVLKAAPHLRGIVRFQFLAASNEVRERVQHLGLSDMIDVQGSLPRKDLKEKYYPEADIFLIPSHSEGFPNSMLEAMAAGLPVVGSPAGAIPEVIVPPKNGFLNPASDHEGLIRDVRKLAQDTTLRTRQGQASHQLCCTTYDIKTVFRRFDTVWNKAIRSH